MRIKMLLLASLLAVLFQQQISAETWRWDNVERIVAVGDLHGGYERFVEILKHAELIDDDLDWVGGKTHFVQTGDVTDRGPDSKKIIDLIRELVPQALDAGGRVHPLVGNHEALNVLGIMTYVHAGEFEAFTSRRSSRLRDKYYARYIKLVKENTPKEEWPVFDKAYRKEWNKTHPLGFVEHRMNWQFDGEYGNWTSDNNAIVVINNMMFLHGGLSYKYVGQTIDSMNEAVSEAIQNTRTSKTTILTDPLGPLWYRGLAQKPESDIEELALLELIESEYEVDHIVIGHTYTPGAIIPRFDGRVIQIDVGLGPAYGSNYAYLEVNKGTIFAIHRGKKMPLPMMSAQRLDYLKQLTKLDPSPSPLLPLIQTLSKKADTPELPAPAK